MFSYAMAINRRNQLQFEIMKAKIEYKKKKTQTNKLKVRITTKPFIRHIDNHE